MGVHHRRQRQMRASLWIISKQMFLRLEKMQRMQMYFLIYKIQAMIRFAICVRQPRWIMT